MNTSDNNTSCNESLTLTPVKKERHVILDENITLTLTPFTLKLYLIFRFESDYRMECSSINKKVKFFMNKTGMSRGKFFESMNELESTGLIKRESKKGEQSKYWIADKFMYFKPAKDPEPIKTPEIDQPPVQQVDYPVQNLDYPVQQVDYITNNSFSNSSHLKPIVDLKSTVDYKDDELFMRFYEVYPNKEKPHVARKAFYKHKPTEDFVSMLVDDVIRRKENNWKNRPKDKIPHPSTYLNAKEWQGEIVKPEINIPKFTPKTKYKTWDDIKGGNL